MPLEIEKLPTGSTFLDAPTSEELEKLRQIREQIEFESLITVLFFGSMSVIILLALVWFKRYWLYEKFISVLASMTRAKRNSSSALTEFKKTAKGVSSKIEKDVQRKLLDS